MNLVIVESPAKAKTINKYLGTDYKVLASYGHIRDLPSKNGSVDPENKFKMIWEIDSFSKKYLKNKKFFWNAGIFFFKANLMLNELSIYNKSLF